MKRILVILLLLVFTGCQRQIDDELLEKKVRKILLKIEAERGGSTLISGKAASVSKKPLKVATPLATPVKKKETVEKEKPEKKEEEQKLAEEQTPMDSFLNCQGNWTLRLESEARCFLAVKNNV